MTVDFVKKYKIAIVDDEASFLNLFTTILSREANLEVIGCLGAKEALLKIPEIKPDLILLDIKMPEFDGFRVFEYLKKDLALNMPKVLFLTNLNETESGSKIDEEFAQNIGVDGYISKTADIGEIIKRVKEALLQLNK
jgi:DNA-binding response OmpR family regulator